jgi:hypothetical protein
MGLAAALAFTGCGRTPPPIVPAEGVVLLNGHPLPHAEVRFVPMFEGLGADYIASAVTDELGRFKLTCPLQDGAAACENRVTVADGPVPEGARGMSAAAQTKASAFLTGLKNRPIPPVYSTVAKTPLLITVTPGTNEYKLELTR